MLKGVSLRQTERHPFSFYLWFSANIRPAGTRYHAAAFRTRQAQQRHGRQRHRADTPRRPQLRMQQPQASRAAVIPASTSPLPPRARPGLPVEFVHTRPSGAATTVRQPLSTTTAFHFSAYWQAVFSRSALICATESPVSRAISPGCGVTISSPAGCGSVLPSASSCAAAFRPSASSTALPAKPGSSFCTSVRVSAARPVLWLYRQGRAQQQHRRLLALELWNALR